MNDAHERFGTYGAWLNPALGDAPRVAYAAELEALGYRTIWVGIGADPVGDTVLLEQLVAATKHAIIATAIINMWQDDPRSIARHHHRIVDRHGPRLLLGIGLCHPETRATYERPFERMVNYVDSLLDDAVPADAIVIGALGTNTLSLAGDKTLGAHPYLTVPPHTQHARETLGSNAFLAHLHPDRRPPVGRRRPRRHPDPRRGSHRLTGTGLPRPGRTATRALSLVPPI